MLFGTGLEAYDAFGLQALRTLLHLEFNGLALVEGLVPIGLNRRKVHKDVLSGLTLNKSIAFGGVEPLHSTLLSAHFLTPVFIHKAELSYSWDRPESYLRLRVASTRHKKRPAGGLPVGLVERVKRNSRATNARNTVAYN
jgi:hypothetical protein